MSHALPPLASKPVLVSTSYRLTMPRWGDSDAHGSCRRATSCIYRKSTIDASDMLAAGLGVLTYQRACDAVSRLALSASTPLEVLITRMRMRGYVRLACPSPTIITTARSQVTTHSTRDRTPHPIPYNSHPSAGAILPGEATRRQPGSQCPSRPNDATHLAFSAKRRAYSGLCA